MDILKTVEGSVAPIDPIRAKQKEDVANMRTSLLACSSNPLLAKQAINNITVLRIYHQISRIIRYTELMDKLENKMYEALEHTIENASVTSNSTWILLMEAQEKLQKQMIESHKLLQPYLDLQEYSIVELQQTADYEAPTTILLDAKSRDKLRTSAQSVLMQLNSSSSEVEEESIDDFN